jgi:enamine deaminase RidA (YjgF/YER057c/UK114 family)
LVSGTASIEPGGRTVWVGDITGQIDRTMEVVAAILHSRGMGFGDVTRATCYYQRPDDRAGFEFWRTAHHQMAMPVVDTHSVVCRGDLLFEIELDAVMATRTR